MSYPIQLPHHVPDDGRRFDALALSYSTLFLNGDLGAALAPAREALDLAVHSFGAADPRTYGTHADLASFYVEAGNLRQAIVHYEASLEGERACGSDSLAPAQYARRLEQIADLHLRMDDPAGAEVRLRQALETAAPHAPSNDPVLARCAWKLGAIRRQLGDRTGAEHFTAEGLAFAGRLVPSVAIQACRFLLEEGRGALERGDSTEAETFFRQMVPVCRTTLPPSDTGRVELFREVAVSYALHSFDVRREQWLRRSVDAARSCESPHLLAYELLGLSRACLANWDIPDSERCAREAMGLLQDASGRQRLALGEVHEVLGMIRVSRGDHSDAAECFRRSLRIRERVFERDTIPPESRFAELFNARLGLAQACARSGGGGNIAESDEICIALCDEARRFGRMFDSAIVTVLLVRGRSALTNGDFEAAEAMYADASDLLGRDGSQAMRADLLVNLAELDVARGSMYADTGYFESAESNARAAVELYEATGRDESPSMAVALSRLIGALEGLGRYAECEPVRGKLQIVLSAMSLRGGGFDGSDFDAEDGAR